MTIKPRTIDNLGVEISVRYAKDKDFLDTKIIEDSKTIPLKTEISVAIPYFPSELEELFDLPKINLPWAQFIAPPNYFTKRTNLFSYQLIPRLGSREEQQKIAEKFASYHEKKKKKRKKEQDREKEREKLATLLSYIMLIDKDLSLINSRKGQYHKG